MTTTTQNEIINDGILRGYTSKEKAYKVDNYPWGFRLKTSIHYWIETKAGKGDRLCTYTIDPKTGRSCAPKCGTYSTFLYLYLSEDEGHVKCGGFDSYDIEYFKMRFPFIIEKVGEYFINEDQKKNIRVNHYQHIYASAPYWVVKYSEAKKEEFKTWLKNTLHHIKNCEFKNLVEYPDRPEEDNPDGEVKMTVVEREEKPEPTITHTITPEKITDILKKVLPGFYVSVSEHKQTFGGNYLAIAMAASGHNINGEGGQKVQVVSLGLDLKTLELNTQVYGGNGGGCIYREPNTENPKERFLAMKSVKVPFRRPVCNEKDVLAAIERFAVNYKNTLIENRLVLKYQDLVNYDELLNLKTL